MSSRSQVCCRSLSCSLEGYPSGAARGPSAEQWTSRLTQLASTNEGSPSWYRASHEPRGLSSSSLAPSTVTATVCRSYRKRIVDLARPDPLCAAVSVRHRLLSSGRQGEVGHHYRILLLMATDGAWRPGLNVMLRSNRLFQQYVVDACAKMKQQQLSY